MAIPQNYDYFLFGKGDKRFIAEANFTSGVNPYLALTWEDVSDSPEIQNATTFAVNTTGRYAYYGAGNKVYNVAYESHNTEVAWQAPDANEVVTCVRTQKNYYMMMQMAMVQNPGMVVHIATWNEATRTGKLYEYMINPASGKIMTEGEQYEYVVPGKVKDMCWKFAMGG